MESWVRKEKAGKKISICILQIKKLRLRKAKCPGSQRPGSASPQDSTEGEKSQVSRHLTEGLQLNKGK